jgi:hypothetical protein
MIYENIDDGRTVVSRKDHICEWCNESIPKGSHVVKRTYKWDGELVDARMHPECFNAMKEYIVSPESFYGEFYPGEHPRGRIGL